MSILPVCRRYYQKNVCLLGAIGLQQNLTALSDTFRFLLTSWKLNHSPSMGFSSSDVRCIDARSDSASHERRWSYEACRRNAFGEIKVDMVLFTEVNLWNQIANSWQLLITEVVPFWSQMKYRRTSRSLHQGCCKLTLPSVSSFRPYLRLRKGSVKELYSEVKLSRSMDIPKDSTKSLLVKISRDLDEIRVASKRGEENTTPAKAACQRMYLLWTITTRLIALGGG